MSWPSMWRYGKIWNPVNEMDRLQREMNRLFTGGGQIIMTYDFPPINVWLSEDDVIVTAELPGVEAGSVDISVVGDALTIGGIRQPLPLKNGELYHRQERNSGKFTRSIKLPLLVEIGKVEAKYERGILQITLPRAEIEKPKKISVRTEA
jgi:HSP20 family protein